MATTRSRARLDKGVCNIEWRDLYPEAIVKHLPIIQSDHSPLLVQLNDGRKNKCSGPFGFLAAWMTHKGFKEFIQHEWNNEKSLSTIVVNLAKSPSNGIYQRLETSTKIRGNY